jgi:uncharacterized repeat protein (TIGR01451 family)
MLKVLRVVASFVALVGSVSPRPAVAQLATLPACDDCSSEAIDIGFTVKFFGQEYSQVYVNNNGNVTFDGPLSAYTPFGLTSTQQTIIAPFFADVDTRATGVVTFFVNDPTDGSRPSFEVHWTGVGYFATHGDKVNDFGLSLVDRSDVAAGDFDIVFTYSTVQWETGDASAGQNGLGGSSAHVGFSNGSGLPETSFELGGSGVPGSFLDGGPNALASHQLNSDTPGKYVFEVRGGLVGQANLSITKVWTPGSRRNEIVFTMRVDNLGPGPATNVVVTDPLPPEVDFVSASPRCGLMPTPFGPVVACVFPEPIGPGTHQTVDIVATKTSSSPFENTAAVSGAEPDPDESDNTFTTRVGFASTCADELRIRSGPAKLTFTPTPTHPSKRRAILQIANQSDVSVDIKSIEPIDGAPYTILKIFPAVPKTIKAHKTREFLVRLIRDAGAGDATATRPYFRISLACGGAG